MPELWKWIIRSLATLLMAILAVAAAYGWQIRLARKRGEEVNFDVLGMFPPPAIIHEYLLRWVIPVGAIILVSFIELPLFLTYGFGRPRPPHYWAHMSCWATATAFYAAALRWHGKRYKRTHFRLTHPCLLAALGTYLLGMILVGKM